MRLAGLTKLAGLVTLGGLLRLAGTVRPAGTPGVSGRFGEVGVLGEAGELLWLISLARLSGWLVSKRSQWSEQNKWWDEPWASEWQEVQAERVEVDGELQGTAGNA